MRVIETPSSLIIIDKEKDKVTKIFTPYWNKTYPWLLKNEIRALSKLNSKHFPKLISYDDNSLTMEYAGKVVIGTKGITKNPHNKWDEREFEYIPDDFESQVNEILNELEAANLRHSDINYAHFLVKDGVVKLIDFELCIEPGEPLPRNYMSTMGLQAKMRSINEEIDDRKMAFRAVDFLKHGLTEIENAINRLPKRKQYHELPFEFKQKTDRRFLKERIEILESVYDFKGKNGLDLGANIGGVSFSLAIKGAKMTAVEKEKEFLDVGIACEKHFGMGVKFVEADLVDYVLSNEKHFDFCTFLATFHWIVKERGIDVATNVLNKISKDCDVMFLETNFGHEEGLVGSEDAMSEAGIKNENDLISYIKNNTEYTEIKNVGKCIGWGRRSTYFCSK